MTKFPLEVGRIVQSKAGRDEGRMFIVVQEIDSDFVLVANGDLRPVSRPKKKRRRHLRATERVAQDIATRIAMGDAVEDHMLRKALLQEEG